MKNQEEYFEQYKDKIYRLLIHCKEDVEYYKSNWDFKLDSIDDMTYDVFCKKIPILEKKIVRKNSEQFLIKNVSMDNLSIDSTSGTDGKPIICYRSKKERFICSDSLWRLRRRFIRDIRPSDKFARFYAFRNKDNEMITNVVLYKENDILLPLFDLSDKKLINYWNEIVKFKPRWLHGPSSTIYNLSLVIKKYSLEQFHFEFIELSGEYVQDKHLKLIEEVFQCPIANQYGCREYWPMAYSDSNGKLMVEKNNIFIEQLYNEGHQKNEILITLLKNNTWPLVRYRLEDLGEYWFEDGKIYLSLHRGRKADFFVMDGNRRFNAIIFSGIARAICELYGMNVILQFQIRKQSENDLLVLLRLNPDANKKEVMVKYKKELQKIVGFNININLEEVEYIKPEEKTGKTKEFINETIVNKM
ncbi:hypothetical protein [Anaerosacchariphilus polymeriproducens]|uniref:Phenylacetate--CoA ligase family protein n=1 Tax=Anaerosacchariphilus polymeriproducens TaxID=1812858 RepID=A0A371AS39_9FIRM|nr:hypothetical protein [Anaerosacchariphilus polymeriproducens]RDU22383.1 hypothetical protein DWV06_13885 [Anaerosacchariphilus polymeriproducens]